MFDALFRRPAHGDTRNRHIDVASAYLCGQCRSVMRRTLAGNCSVCGALDITSVALAFALAKKHAQEKGRAAIAMLRRGKRADVVPIRAAVADHQGERGGDAA